MKYPGNALAIIMVGAATIGLSTCQIWQTNNPFDPNTSHTANVAVVAGVRGTQGTMDGTGSGALFGLPQGIVSDGTSLYVTDAWNNNIRKIVISTGVVTTLAGSASGASGNVNATGTAARFYNPVGICTDGTNLYVADQNNSCVRKVVISSGLVTTLAGSPVPIGPQMGTTDGTGTAATFRQPYRICTDGTNLYVTDFNAHNIRQIVISSAVVTTLAGSTTGQSGATDGPGASALFSYPKGLCVIGAKLLVQDNTNSSSPPSLRLVQLPSGVVTAQHYSDTNIKNQNWVGDSPVYDGSLYLYSAGNTKFDTSSWYGIYFNTSPYDLSAVCLSGTDLYYTDAYGRVILKLLSITTP
jgi:hypothetical protein